MLKRSTTVLLTIVAAISLATITILSSCTTLDATKIVLSCDDTMLAEFPLPKSEWMIQAVQDEVGYYIVTFLRKDRTRFKSVGVAGTGTETEKGMIAFGFKVVAPCIGKRGDAGSVMTFSQAPSLESPAHDSNTDLGI